MIQASVIILLLKMQQIKIDLMINRQKIIA